MHVHEQLNKYMSFKIHSDNYNGPEMFFMPYIMFAESVP